MKPITITTFFETKKREYRETEIIGVKLWRVLLLAFASTLVSSTMLTISGFLSTPDMANTFTAPFGIFCLALGVMTLVFAIAAVFVGIIAKIVFEFRKLEEI